jgi:hypothetical protein
MRIPCQGATTSTVCLYRCRHHPATTTTPSRVKHLVGKVKQSSGETAIATAEDGSGVAVVHPDPASQAYLASKGVADILASIVQRVGRHGLHTVASGCSLLGLQGAGNDPELCRGMAGCNIPPLPGTS